MKEQFIPYEQALELKELGYGNNGLDYYCGCLAYYGNHKTNFEGKLIPNNNLEKYHKFDYSQFINAPLWQQVFDWFREKYKLEYWLSSSNDVTYYNVKEVGKVVYWDLELLARKAYNTYEEARLECLKKLIQIVKDENRI